ncbi:MAG: secretin N-terminal domain-containing protein [Gammaproteobacteria bacterium]
MQYSKILLIPLLTFSIIFHQPSFATETLPANQPISIDLQSVTLQDALHLLAKTLNRSLIISPAVTGNVSLHLQHMPALQAFDLILNSHGLTRIQQDQVWFVMPREELMQQKQDELKLQEIVAATAPLISRVWQIHYAKVEEIGHLIQDNNGSLLSKRGYLHVDGRTNQLCIQDTEQHVIIINKLIKQLDIPVQQVLIETRLASVDSDFERELGVNFSVQQVTDESKSDVNLMGSKAGARYSLAVARLIDGSMLDVQLAALESNGHGELISSPSLFTANQQTASIEAGEEIPYQEISRSGSTGVAFKKAVLSLKVTPQVLPDHKVLLQLQINQDKPSNRIVLGVPAITTRQISTNVLAISGQTIVLGGIFESNKDDVTQGIPFLSKIPLVGLLFQQQNVVENKRELLVFVTPRIINTGYK